MKKVLSISIVAVIVLISVSCRSGSHSQNSVNGPAFQGRLILATENEHQGYQTIYEIKNAPANGSIIPKPLLFHVQEFALSPDQRTILYTKLPQRHLFRLALDSGEVVEVLPSESSSPGWSPDGTRYCYVNESTHELVVTNASGKAQVVTKADGKTYTPYGFASGDAKPNVFGAFEKAVWVAPNRIVFQRFKGAFPDSAYVTQKTWPANATALAKLDEKPSVTDAPMRLFVGPRCERKSMVEFRSDDIPEQRYVVANFDDFEKTKLRGLPAVNHTCKACKDLFKFTENTCQWYYVKTSSTDLFKNQNMLSFLDPESFEKRDGASLGNDRQLYDVLLDSEEKFAAIAFEDDNKYSISIRELTSGGETILTNSWPSEGPHPSLRVMKFVAWLPN